MHILVVTYKDGRKQYFGPFPTFFRANEYAAAVTDDPMYAHHDVTALILPCTIRVRWK